MAGKRPRLEHFAQSFLGHAHTGLGMRQCRKRDVFGSVAELEARAGHALPDIPQGSLDSD